MSHNLDSRTETRIKVKSGLAGALNGLAAFYLWIAGVAGLVWLTYLLSGTDLNDSLPTAAKVRLTVLIITWTIFSIYWCVRTTQKEVWRMVKRAFGDDDVSPPPGWPQPRTKKGKGEGVFGYVFNPRTARTKDEQKWLAIWLVIIIGVPIVLIAIALVGGTSGTTKTTDTPSTGTTQNATEADIARCEYLLPSNSASTMQRLAASERYRDCVYG